MMIRVKLRGFWETVSRQERGRELDERLGDFGTKGASFVEAHHHQSRLEPCELLTSGLNQLTSRSRFQSIDNSISLFLDLQESASA
jgi:hypothetical protein